jgi:hypothetical protein
VVSFVINNILLNQPSFKCGCRCTEYETPNGYKFDLASARAPQRPREAPRGAARAPRRRSRAGARAPRPPARRIAA